MRVQSSSPPKARAIAGLGSESRATFWCDFVIFFGRCLGVLSLDFALTIEATCDSKLEGTGHGF